MTAPKDRATSGRVSVPAALYRFHRLGERLSRHLDGRRCRRAAALADMPVEQVADQMLKVLELGACACLGDALRSGGSNITEPGVICVRR